MTADDLSQAFATLPAAWRAVLPGWTAQLTQGVVDQVRLASGAKPIGPPDPFRALRLVGPAQVKVVIFGQDPYPKPGHADGLAFSAGHGRPRSLIRIFEVLAADRPGFVPPAVWKLDDWAHQGVLLLNPSLSVEIGRAGSHMNCGWQALTSEIVFYLCGLEAPPVFMLWGKPANDFFDSASKGCMPARIFRTRHPSYDFKRDFMREGSHFAATADLIDWWRLGAGRVQAAHEPHSGIQPTAQGAFW